MKRFPFSTAPMEPTVSGPNHPELVEVSINTVKLTMEVDTGAGVSLIPEYIQVYQKRLFQCQLKTTFLCLRGVSGPIITVL